MGGNRLLFSRRAEVSVAPVLAPAAVEACRAALLHAVAEGRAAQLAQLMRDMPVLSREVEDRFDLTRNDQRRSWLRARTPTAAWSQVLSAWRRRRRRLVILGEPGHGKTVCALTLLIQANAADRPGKPVAELFPLVDWFHWQAGHPDGDLADWLADQLAVTYSGLPAADARALVTQHLVVPFLDGLDEVPASHRGACLAAVDAYTGASDGAGQPPSPPWPFVLTCRTTEYNDLAPDWAAADRQVELTGLEPSQVSAALGERLAGQPGWDSLRQRLAGGDQDLARLLSSPFLLGVALMNPRELLTAGTDDVEGQLWERCLSIGGQAFDGAGPGEVRQWLGSLARSMEVKRYLWLHELYLLAPDPDGKRQRRFTRRIARRTGFLVGVADGLLALVAAGWAAGVAAGLVAGLVTLLWLLRSQIPLMLLPFYERGPEVMALSVCARVPWRDRAAAAGRRLARALSEWLPDDWLVDEMCIWAVRTGVLLAAGGGLATFIGLDNVIFVAVGLAVLPVLRMFDVGSEAVTGEVPRRLAGRGPYAVVWAAILKAEARGLYFLLAAVAAGGLIGALRGEPVSGLLFGLGAGLVAGAVGAASGGFKACIYNGVRPPRVARRGLRPRYQRSIAFLEWCTGQPRGWLCRADGYEFRYRGLQDHLGLTAIGQEVEDWQRRAGADPQVRRELASVLRTQAAMLRAAGRTEQALAAIGTLATVHREMGSAVRFELGLTLDTQTAWLRALGRTEEALTAAVDASQAYRAAGVDEIVAARLAAVLAAQADCLRELGRTEEALAANGEAIDAYRAAAAGSAGRRRFASSLARLVGWLRALGQPRDELAQEAEFQLTCMDGLVESLLLRVPWLSELGRDGEAQETAQEAMVATERTVQVARRLAALDPHSRDNLAEALAAQADWLWATERTDEAMALIAESVRLARPLAAGNATMRGNLAALLDTQAAWMHQLEHTQEALASTAEAVSLYWQLETGWPGTVQPELEWSLSRQAEWLRGLGRPQEVRTATQLAKSLTAMR